jgi:hypothetical protein
MTGAAARRPVWGAAAGRPGLYKDDSDICYYHTTYGANPDASGSREMGRPLRIKHSRRRHDFFTG